MTSWNGKPLEENLIRPDHLMQNQAERYASDLRRLMQHRDEFVSVSCPACFSNKAQTAFEKYELIYMICSDCGTVYINPRPNPSLLEWYYSTSENYAYWNKYIFPASEEARRERIFRPRVEQIAKIIERHNVETDTLLEVGAGFGTFCEEVQRTGLFSRVVAVEPVPDLAETCRRKAIEVIEKPIEQVQAGEIAANVIACFEVIEHLFSPRDFVLGCSSVLIPGGLIVITCPNIRGFDLVTLQAASGTVDSEHLNYFHPSSLSHLLAECGFKVLEVQTPGSLDAELVRKKALAGEFDISAHPFLRQILLDEWERIGDAFQQFLAANGLSSHMSIVAQKLAN